MGLNGMYQRKSKARDAMLARVKTMYDKGYSVREIAAILHVSYGSANKWVHMSGATIRSRGSVPKDHVKEPLEGRFTIEGITLFNVHEPDECEGRPCVLHNPTDHALRKWRLHWREDRAIFERLCPKHGIGHPDPDQFAYWREINQDWQGIHGCCGCCAEA